MSKRSLKLQARRARHIRHRDTRVQQDCLITITHDGRIITTKRRPYETADELHVRAHKAAGI